MQKKLTKNQLFSLEQESSALPIAIHNEISRSFHAGIPFPYLLNEAEFYQHYFYVNQNVLIPRPETEQLVDMIIQSGKKVESMLDVGVGSGVILLTLMKAQVAKNGLGVDLSPAALEVAQINAQRLRLSNIEFKLSDRLQAVTQKFDLIVSNPPYIKTHAHRSGVHHKVNEFEPSQALYIPDEQYEAWFKEFFRQIKEHLLPGGEFFMEGHEAEVEDQVAMLQSSGFKTVQCIKDWSGAPRFLKAAL